MTKANELLFRIEEASVKKLDLSPIDVKLSGGSGQLQKRETTQSQEVKKGVEDALQSEQPGGNDLNIAAGSGTIQGHPVLFVEVKKSKPFQDLVIARRAIQMVGLAMAQTASKAAEIAEKKNMKFQAVVIAGYFKSGVETRRFRACAEYCARLIGGRIVDRAETGNEQLYLVG